MSSGSKSSFNPSTTMASANEPLTLYKRYKFRKESGWSTSHYHVTDEKTGQIMFYNHVIRKAFSSPLVTLSTTPDKYGPTIATSKARSFTRGFNYFVGDPGNLDSHSWPYANSRGMGVGAFEFTHEGKPYTWKKTHDKALGGSSMGTRVFKLTEGGYDSHKGRVLMIFNPEWGSRHAKADIDFLAPIDQSLELAALMVILTIQDELRRAGRSGAAGAAAGGAAGGGGC